MIFYKINLFSCNYQYKSYILYYNYGVTSYYLGNWHSAMMQFGTACQFYKEYDPSNFDHLLNLHRLILYCMDRYYIIVNASEVNRSIAKSLIDDEEKIIRELKKKIKIRNVEYFLQRW